jgi:hypothetical protein
LHHVPGYQNIPADLLSRSSHVLSTDSNNAVPEETTVMLPDAVWIGVASLLPSTWPESIAFFLEHDCWFEHLENISYLEKELGNFTLKEGKLYRIACDNNRLLYIPSVRRETIFRSFQMDWLTLDLSRNLFYNDVIGGQT